MKNINFNNKSKARKAGGREEQKGGKGKGKKGKKEISKCCAEV